MFMLRHKCHEMWCRARCVITTNLLFGTSHSFKFIFITKLSKCIIYPCLSCGSLLISEKHCHRNIITKEQLLLNFKYLWCTYVIFILMYVIWWYCYYYYQRYVNFVFIPSMDVQIYNRILNKYHHQPPTVLDR